MIQKHFVPLVFLITLAACGKDSDDKNTEPALITAPDAEIPLGLTSWTDDLDIHGVWQTECQPCGRSYCIQTADFSDSRLIWSKDQYADRQCATSQMHIRHIGSFTASNGFVTSKLAQAHMKLDFVSFKAAAERSQSCGFNSWPLDRWLDVTGRYCPATPEKGGVWTNWTQPGESFLQAHYIKSDRTITFAFSDGDVTYTKQ